MTAPRSRGASSPPASPPDPSCAAPAGARQSHTPPSAERPHGRLRRAVAAWLLAAAALAAASVPAQAQTLPVISIEAVKHPVSEGTDTEAAFTLTRTGATDAELAVNLGIRTGDGDVFRDLEPGRGTTDAHERTETFAVGEATRTLSYAIVDDNVDEPSGYADVFIETSNDYAVNATSDSAIVSVRDDDAIGLEMSVSALSVEEGEALALTLRSTNAVVYYADIVVTLTERDSALFRRLTAEADDYELVGPLRLPAGQESAATMIRTVEDSVVEGDETSEIGAVYLVNPQNPQQVSKTFTITIVDDDEAALSVADVTVEESAGAARFTVTQSAASSADVTVDWAASAGAGDTAAVGADFSAASGTVRIPAGDTSATFDVPIADDRLVEADETFTVTLSDAVAQAGAVSIAGATATATIANDDVPAWTTRADPSQIAEDGGSSTLTVDTGGVFFAADQMIFLRITGGAVAGSDFMVTAADGTALVPSNTLTLAPGATTVSATIEAVPDDEDESAETIHIDPEFAGRYIGDPVTIVIVDDDDAPSALPEILVTAVKHPVREGTDTEAAFTLTRTGATDADLTVNLRIETGDGDMFRDLEPGRIGSDAYQRTVTFAVDQATKTLSYVIVDDNVDEFPSYAEVSIEASDGYAVSATAGKALVEVGDDDAIELEMSVSALSVEEGEALALTLRSTNGVIYHANILVELYEVDPAIYPSLTAEANDYERVTDFPLPAGQESAATMIRTVEDSVVEGDETFGISAGVPRFLEFTVFTITVVDDDEAALSVADATAEESGGAARFTVTQSAVSSADVTVDWAASAGAGDTAAVGADFSAASGTVRIPAGDTSATFDVPIAHDRLDEADETFTVTLSNVVVSEGSVSIADATATATIADDDAPPVLTLSVSRASISENGGTATVTVGTGPGSTFTQDEPIMLTLTGTATQGDDYTISGESLTLPAGIDTRPSSVTAVLTGMDDALDEEDETVTISASRGGASFGAELTVTLTDNDNPPSVGFDQDTVDVGEGDTAELRVALSAPSARRVTVSWSAMVSGAPLTADAGDFTPASGELVFAPGETEMFVSVATTHDTTDEPGQSFRVELTLPPGANAQGGRHRATVTIVDDDDPPTIDVEDARVNEHRPNPVDANTELTRLTVTLSEVSEKTVRFRLRGITATGDTAVEDDDYTNSNPFSLVISPGALERPAERIRITNDSLDEPEETFTAELYQLENATAPAEGARATITIEDDDPAPSVGVADAQAMEGEDIVFTARLDAASGKTVTVRWATSVEADDTASANDFFAGSGTLTFTPGVTSQDFTVGTEDEGHDEADETFTVTLSSPSNAALQADRASARGTIRNDDPDPVVTLELAEGAVSESGPRGGRVIARLDRVSGAPTTVTFSAVAVPPAVAGDFELGNLLTRTIPAYHQDSGAYIRIVIPVDNDTDAPDKSVTISGVASNSLGVDGPDDITLIIEDDDEAPQVILALSESSIRESDDADASGSQHQTEVSVSLTHPSSEPTTVTLTPSEHFTASAGALTVPAGATAGSGTVTLTAVDNATDAPDRSVTVRASAANAQGIEQPDGIALIIADEDAPPTVLLALSHDSIQEDGGDRQGEATVQAVLSHPSSETTTVTVAASGADPLGAGHVVSGATLTIPAGAPHSESRATIAAVDNDTDAPDQRVTVSATALNSQGIAGDPEPLVLVIEDDEDAPSVTLHLPDAPIVEAGGSTAVTAELSHPSSQATTLTVSTAPVAPAVAADFEQAGETLTVPATATASEGTVTVTAEDNDIDAPDRRVTVSAAAANDQGIAGDPVDVVLTIADDDERGLVLDPESVAVSDNDEPLRSAKLKLASQPTETVTVTVTVPAAHRSRLALTNTLGDLFADATAVEFASGTGTFTPENWNVPQIFAFFVFKDDDARTDLVNIALQAAGGDYGPVRGTVAVTIIDTDSPTRNVVLSVERDEVPEGGGAASLTVTARLDGSPRASETSVAVTVGAGTAQAEDFTASPASFTLAIAAGADSASRVVLLIPADDDVDEAHETVTVSGTTAATVENATTVLGVTPAAVTIVDDDQRAVSVSVETLQVDEEGSASYTVVLGSAPTGPVTVTPSVTGDGDVTVSPQTLGFTADNWSTPQTVTVAAAADDDSTDDTATVNHALSGGDYASGVSAAPVAVTVTDGDERAVVLSAPSVRFDEGASASYTVALSTRPSGTVTVTPRVTDNPDVTVTPASLRFTGSSWSTAQTVTVAAAVDANGLEDRATVSHGVSGADYGSANVIGPDLAVTVNDVETTELIVLSVSPASVPEDGSRRTVTVTATLDGAARAEPTAVAVEVRGGTASVTDFTASPAALNLTIPANATEGRATFRLTATRDTLDEGASETVTVRGSTEETVGLEVEPAEITIEDDDGRGFTVSRPSLVVNEEGSASYTVALASEPIGGLVTVTPSVAGDTDVTVTPESLQFTSASWNVRQTVTVSVAADPDGDDEAATITHAASGADYDGIEGGVVALDVRDNDQTSRAVRLAVEPGQVEEDGGPARVTVTAALDGAARTVETAVAVAVTGGSAEAVKDFAEVAGFTVTIPAGSTEAAGTFTLSPVDDALDEGAGETVTLGGETEGLSVQGATLTIADDDERGLAASAESVTVPEEGSAEYAVALSSQPSGAVTVAVSVRGNSQVTVSPSSLSFTADNWDAPQPVTVSAAHDDDAGDDTAELRHTASGADYGGVTALALAVSVTDNDARAVTVSESSLTFREGASAAYTVVLETRPTTTVTVRPSVAGDSDVTVSPSSLSFTTSSWKTPKTVTVRAGQDADKVADSATVSHAVAGADYGEHGVTAAPVSVTVTDDDVPSEAITLAVSSHSVRENGGRARLTVTATLDASPEEEAVEVVLSLVGGSAEAGTDFEAIEDVTLTLPAGRASATARVSVTPVNDAVDEGAGETVRIEARIESQAPASLIASLNPSSLELTIVDDDERAVAVSRTSLSVNEERSTSYTVRLGSAPTGPVTVTPSVEGDSDVTVSPERLEFTAASWNAAQTLTVSVGDDADGDDETATIAHAVAGADYGANGVTARDVSVSVNDNDQASTAVALSVEPAVVEEDGGRRHLTVTATFNGASRTENTDVAVTVTGGTAEAGADFAATGGVTVTIKAGETDAEALLPFSPVNDDVDEGLSETVVLGGSAPGLSVGTATLTIADDDGRGIELPSGAVGLSEEGSASYEVALATEPTGPVTVRVSVRGNSDVTVSPSSLSFTADNWDAPQPVTVSAAHDDDAGDDTAELRHTASGADYGGVTALALAVAVTDNDARAVSVSESSLTFREGASAAYTVVLETRPTTTVTVRPSVAGDSDVTVSPSSLSFTTSSWKTPKTVTVRAGQDADKVADSATVSHAVAGADYGEHGVTAAPVSVTVTDDDVPSEAITLAVSSHSVRENGGRARLTVTATLDASPEEEAVEVVLSLVGGSAEAGTDFEAIEDVTLTLPAGRASATARVSVTPVNDAVDEGAGETVRIEARIESQAPASLIASLNPSSLELTIVDDDERAVAVSRTSLSVNEERSTSYTVRLGSAPTGPVTVTPSVEGDSDVTVSPERLEFTAASWNAAQTLTVSVGDDADGDDETATIAHAVAGADYGANGVTARDVSVSVNDDDQTSTAVRLSVDPAVVAEDGGSVNLTVTATLNGASRATETEVVLTWTGGSAVAGTDFAGPRRFTLFIPFGETQGSVILAFIPLDDEVAERGGETVNVGGRTAGLSVQGATLTLSDDDSPALVLSARALTVAEGGTGSYTVGLATEPTGPVTVTIDRPGSGVTVEPSRLDFATGDWETPQPVEVTAAADADGSDGAATLRHRASGGDYGSVRAQVAVTVTDDDALPGAPERFMALPEDGRVALSWVAPDDGGSPIVRYEFRIDTGGWRSVPGGAAATAFEATGLANDRAYGFAVRAVNGVGPGPGSEAGAKPGRGICARHRAVREFVLAYLLHRGGISSCGQVTDADLAKVNSLSLNGTGLTSLSASDFAGLTGVVTIFLSQNELTSLPAGLFAGMVNLRELHLTDNRIASLPSGAFDGLEALEYLNLSNNRLRAFPWAAFDALPKLRSLRLSGNPGYKRGMVATRQALTVPAGGTGTYRVWLTAHGSTVTTVRVAPHAQGVTVSPPSLRFTWGTWFRAQTVTVSAAPTARRGRFTLSHVPDGHYDDYLVDSPAECPVEPVAGKFCPVTMPEVAVTVTAGLSVADARAEEAPGAVLEFTVTLGAAASATASVSWTTEDGSATAGEDYAAASGRLTFAQGETQKTVTVQVLDDAHDEGEETFTLRLSNASGAAIADGEATGTIANSDPIPKAWLARFGRTVADHVTEAIGARLAGPPGSGSQVTLGGQPIALEGAGEGEAFDAMGYRAPRLAGRLEGRDAWERREWPGGAGDGWLRGRTAQGLRTMTDRELLLASSFRLALGADGGDAPGSAGTRWTAWGRAAASRFEGEDGTIALDGEVTTVTLGADAARGRWLGGVALAHSTGSGSFRDEAQTGRAQRGKGELDSTLASIHPYLRYSPSERLSLWGLLGYGAGSLEIETAGTATGNDSPERWKTGTEMWMAAAGARGVLVEAEASGGFELAARSDARLVRMSSEAAGGAGSGKLAATRTATRRLRLALEGSYRVEFDGGRTLTPSLEMGVREDGGDAEIGTGLEVGAGLRFADAARGLSAEVGARALVAHEASAYREWGVSGALRIDPGASARGLSLTLAPAWGAATGGTERLWSAHDAGRFAANDAVDPAGHLAAEAGYGFAAFGGRGAMTPFAGLVLSEAGERAWRTGVRWKLGRDIAFGVEGTRREPANDDAAEHGLMLRATVRW